MIAGDLSSKMDWDKVVSLTPTVWEEYTVSLSGIKAILYSHGVDQ